MNKSTTSLAIRVKLPEDDNPQLQLQEEITILWDRVIAAVLLVTLIVGLTILGIQYWRSMEQLSVPIELKSPLAPQVDNSEPALTTTKMDTDARLTMGSQPQSKTNPITTNQTKPSSGGEPSATSKEPSAINKEPSTFSEKPSAVNKEPYTVKKEPSAKEKLQATNKNLLARPEQAPGVNNEPSSTAKAPPARHSADVKIHSSNIQDAVLTTSIKNRIPGPKAQATLDVGPELLTVYFVTKISGFQAKPVYFQWYRNNQRAAKVKIRPKHDVTQIISSKYINEDMTGDWRVELLSDAGETLAESAFTVATQNL